MKHHDKCILVVKLSLFIAWLFFKKYVFVGPLILLLSNVWIALCWISWNCNQPWCFCFSFLDGAYSEVDDSNGMIRFVRKKHFVVTTLPVSIINSFMNENDKVCHILICLRVPLFSFRLLVLVINPLLFDTHISFPQLHVDLWIAEERISKTHRELWSTWSELHYLIILFKSKIQSKL